MAEGERGGRLGDAERVECDEPVAAGEARRVAGHIVRVRVRVRVRAWARALGQG